MTAAEAKEMLINSFINDEYPNQFESRLNVFIDQVCKEQREKCLHNATREADGMHGILTAEKPDGL